MQCGAHVCVTQHFTQALYVHSALNAARGVGVAQGVEIPVGDRLLVTGERVPYEHAQEIQADILQETPEVESTWEQEYLHGLYIALAVVLLLVMICIAFAFLGRNRDA